MVIDVEHFLYLLVLQSLWIKFAQVLSEKVVIYFSLIIKSRADLVSNHSKGNW